MSNVRRFQVPGVKYLLFFAYSQTSKEQQPTLLAVGLSSDDAIALCDPVSSRILNTLQGESYKVRYVSLSPCDTNNGGLLAAGTSDGKVLIWDYQKQKCVAELKGYTSWVNCVAFSPDGSLLASGSRDKNVRLWDVATRSAGPVLRGHTGNVLGVAFSPSGRLLASAASDYTVRLWNMPEGTPGLVLTHKDHVYSVAFSPVADSNLLASGCCDGMVKLWDVSGEEAKLVREWEGHKGNVWSVVFSPDGSQLASGSISLKLWSVANGLLLKTLKEKEEEILGVVRSVAFHPSGHQLACVTSDAVHIWTICEWNDRLHHLFGPELKRIVFVLMCIKSRQENNNDVVFRLPMQMWLSIFQSLAVSIEQK